MKSNICTLIQEYAYYFISFSNTVLDSSSVKGLMTCPTCSEQAQNRPHALLWKLTTKVTDRLGRDHCSIMVSTCGPGLMSVLALSPLVAKAPLVASPQRKQSPSRSEIILLDRLRKRRMRYLSPQSKATNDKHKDSMVIKDDYCIKQCNNETPSIIGDQLGPNSGINS